MEEKQITVKNLTVNYKIFGNGPRKVLMLHGWPSKSDTWQQVGDLLSQKDVTVIVPDLPGFGKSQEPSKPWKLDTYVEWLFEFIQRLPELSGGFYLVGHSFGGALASKFTLKYSQQVEKLFLVSAACVRKPSLPKKIMLRIAKAIKIFSFLPYYDVFRRACYKFIVRKSDYPNISGIMKETYLNVISDDLSEKLYFIKVPTIIIWGDKDVLTPIAQAHFINKKIENSVLEVIPDAGHALQLKNADTLAAKIVSHI